MAVVRFGYAIKKLALAAALACGGGSMARAEPPTLYLLSDADLGPSNNVNHLFWVGNPFNAMPVILELASSADFARDANNKPQVGLQYAFTGGKVVTLTATVTMTIDSAALNERQKALSQKYGKSVGVTADLPGQVDAYLVYQTDSGNWLALPLGQSSGQTQSIAFTADLTALSRSELAKAFSIGKGSAAIVLEVSASRNVSRLVSSKPFWSSVKAAVTKASFLPSDSVWSTIVALLSPNEMALAPAQWDQRLAQQLGKQSYSYVGGHWVKGWDTSTASAQSSLDALKSADKLDVSIPVASVVSSVAAIALTDICASGSQLAVNLDNGGEVGCAGLAESKPAK